MYSEIMLVLVAVCKLFRDMGSVYGMDGVQIVTAQQYLPTFLQYNDVQKQQVIFNALRYCGKQRLPS